MLLPSRLKIKLARLFSRVAAYSSSVVITDLKVTTMSKLKFCGKGVHFHGRIRFVFPENIRLGNNVIVGENAYVDGRGGLIVGNNTHISRNVVIHDYTGTCLPYDNNYILKPVFVGDNVWIGTNVVIVPGVEIGNGAIIGAGTVVSKSVPSLAIVGNQQIRIIKYREKAHYEELVAAESYGGISGRILVQSDYQQPY